MVNAVVGTILAACVKIIYQEDKPSVWLVCETPDNWFTDKGMDSKNAGDIQKLYWFVGALLGAIQHRAAGGIGLQEIWTTIPKAWKGQTPKRIMVERAMRQLDRCGIWPEKTIPDDAGEAVLLARIAGEKFRTKIEEGKGWARIWSRSWEAMADVVKIRMWSPEPD